MTGSDYGDAVAAFLDGRGWRTASSQVRSDTTLVRGVRADADDAARLVALGVSGADASVTEKHVKFLLKAASDADADADAALVSSPGGLTADARALVDEYGVDVVDAARIRRETDWRPDGAAKTGGAATSADAADAPSAETPADETPETTGTGTGASDVRSELEATGEDADAAAAPERGDTTDADGESAGEQTADSTAGDDGVAASAWLESDAEGAAEAGTGDGTDGGAGDEADGGDDGGADDSGDGRWVVDTADADSASAASKPTDSATTPASTGPASTDSEHDDDPLFGGAADAPSSQAGNDARPSGFGRRDVVKLGGVAVVGAGGWVAYTRTGLLGGGANGPEQVVRDFYAAIDDGDAAAARALVHENATRTVASLDPSETTVEITGLERVSSDADGVARFRVTLRVDGRTEQATVVV
ncbi:MAG: hypothetical protein ABEH83_08540, partial [Halobacterium sp.]